jgi:hypothetical protein
MRILWFSAIHGLIIYEDIVTQWQHCLIKYEDIVTQWQTLSDNVLGYCDFIFENLFLLLDTYWYMWSNKEPGYFEQ